MQVVDIESIEDLQFNSKHDSGLHAENTSSKTNPSESHEESIDEATCSTDNVLETNEAVIDVPVDSDVSSDGCTEVQHNNPSPSELVPVCISRNESRSNARASPDTSVPLRVFTSFSGYDSQIMALERLRQVCGLKYEVVGWCEIDKYAITSHNAAFPQYANLNYGDITKIDWSQVQNFDVFTYSSPCQSFSKAGLREGGDRGAGTTSSLIWSCLDAITVKRPKYLLFENVMGLIDNTMWHTFEEWQEELCKLGYINYGMVLNAADYGVPQHRERVIMVSIRIDEFDSLPSFDFPKPMNLTKTPEMLLEHDVQAQYYLTQRRIQAYLDLLENAKPGYKVETDFRKYKEVAKKPIGRCVERFVTPTCRGGVLPTLMASSNGAPTNMFSTSSRPCPGVVEIWDTNFKSR